MSALATEKQINFILSLSNQKDVLMRKDELEHENGSIAGRYELKV